jgi:hypothetical protein
VAVKQQLIQVLGEKQEESWLGLSHDNVVKLFHAENDSNSGITRQKGGLDWLSPEILKSLENEENPGEPVEKS